MDKNKIIDKIEESIIIHQNQSIKFITPKFWFLLIVSLASIKFWFAGILIGVVAWLIIYFILGLIAMQLGWIK